MRFVLGVWLLLSGSYSLAQVHGRATGGYLGSDYQSFKDSEFYFNGEFRFKKYQDYSAFVGFANARREYNGGPEVQKNSFLLAGSVKFAPQNMYVEAGAMVSDTDKIGAYGVYSLMPHTTAIKDFDLGLGIDYAIYSTGDITTIKPQVLYFINDHFMVGHTSWFFNTDGNHYAWRNYLRTTYALWSSDIGIAGGDTREDIGLIDQFTAYSFSLTRKFKRFTLGASTERYEAKLRSGWQWGVSSSWRY